MRTRRAKSSRDSTAVPPHFRHSACRCWRSGCAAGHEAVYALFYEDDLVLVATIERDSHALALAEVISRQRCRPVVVVWDRGNGDARLCARFIDGAVAEISAEDQALVLDRLAGSVARLASYGR